MRILIVTPLQDRATGNWVTATRYQRGLEVLGHRVALCSTPLQSTSLQQETEGFRPDLAILLHGYRTGGPWLQVAAEHPIPYVVVLTGTDINHGIADPEQGPVIESVLAQAAAVILQNPLTEQELRRDRPDLAGRLYYVAPGIELGAAPFALRKKIEIPADALLFLCPTSLRPVKGGLELLLLFDAVAKTRCDFRLVFCGPVLDADYSERFFAALQSRSWASWLGTICSEAMPAAMREADVVLNNSVSEGLPNALLEAAALGRPILAHDIPGNAAVVEAGVNGLLFSDQNDFTLKVKRLVDNPHLLKQLSRPTPERYDPRKEAAELERICCLCIGS